MTLHVAYSKTGALPCRHIITSDAACKDCSGATLKLQQCCAEAGTTLCDLRAILNPSSGDSRTLIPHEVKLGAQVHKDSNLHYADAVRGDSFEAVKLPLAQLFMYLVSSFSV